MSSTSSSCETLGSTPQATIKFKTQWRILSVGVLAGIFSACSSVPVSAPKVTIQRTINGIPHISAPDMRSLAYGVAYAHAQDNVCQTADLLVTVRGQRSRFFGAEAIGQLALRRLPNEQIDMYVASHMDDAALSRAWSGASHEVQDLVQGYVEGYNRYLRDNASQLPIACRGKAWVTPMSESDYRRFNEILMTQGGITALADAVVTAQPPVSKTSSASLVDMAEAVQALREMGIVEPRFGSNAWALGRQVTENKRGILLGNPHFPWVSSHRFWQMHLTIPGQLDVMGASLGLAPLVHIGFNANVAWSQTVSTGKRFTLHELKLLPGDPTQYFLDGKPVKMQSHVIAGRTLWRTHFGPVVVMPKVGLNWTTETAYAVQDANTGNTRTMDTWLGLNRARNVSDIRDAQRNLGIPWVNTIAADKNGNVLYNDFSTVPDVDEALIKRCAPSARAAALREPAGLFVLDGSRSECQWHRDSTSPVPGLIPTERMPVTVRDDWVQNANDSFFYTHPNQRFGSISPLVGDDVMRRPRTRASLTEISEMIARGPVTPQAVREQIFGNRNHVAEWVLPDLLAACTQAPSIAALDGCKALAGFTRVNDLSSRGAHLFREFWRTAQQIPGVYRVPFDRAQPMSTPTGLKMADATVATKVWAALELAVRRVRDAGFALDAPLGEVQHPSSGPQPSTIGLHGGDDMEGVLNYLGDRLNPGLTRGGLLVDYGTSYIQTVTFDEKGPVAHALLTYGQSSNPESQHATDQTLLYSRKSWPALPFHPDDIRHMSLGDPLVLEIR